MILTENDMGEIQNNVRLLSIKEIDDISHYLFDSYIDARSSIWKEEV